MASLLRKYCLRRLTLISPAHTDMVKWLHLLMYGRNKALGSRSSLLPLCPPRVEGVGSQYQGPLQEVCVKAPRCGYSCRIRHYLLSDPRAGDPRASESTPADNGPCLSTPHRTTTHRRRLGLISGPAC